MNSNELITEKPTKWFQEYLVFWHKNAIRNRLPIRVNFPDTAII